MKVIGAIGSLGAARWRPARELAAGLDIVDATGLPYALGRFRGRAEQSDREQRETEASYAEIWGGAAQELDAELRELAGGYLEISRGATLTRVWRRWTMLDDAVTLKLVHDKSLVHDLLVEAGVPVPDYVEFDYRNHEEAEAFLHSVGVPTVVKPASGTGSGSGVTSGVRSRADLIRARARAARLSTRLLVERQIVGEMYRLLFLDLDLIGAVRRGVPQLRGDGRSTVLELIELENERRRSQVGGWSRPSISMPCWR